MHTKSRLSRGGATETSTGAARSSPQRSHSPCLRRLSSSSTIRTSSGIRERSRRRRTRRKELCWVRTSMACRTSCRVTMRHAGCFGAHSTPRQRSTHTRTWSSCQRRRSKRTRSATCPNRLESRPATNVPRGGGNEQTKMFSGAPAGFEDGGRTAQECYEFARSTWKELAPRWADEIKPLLEQAVKEW